MSEISCIIGASVSVECAEVNHQLKQALLILYAIEWRGVTKERINKSSYPYISRFHCFNSI